MDKQVFSGFGIEIVDRGGRFFVKFDGGGIAIQMREDEITAEEASKAQCSEKDAYEVLLAVQRRQSHKKGLS